MVRLRTSGNRNREEVEYVRYHGPRFVFLLGLIRECLEKLGAAPDRPVRYLDVGPHFLTGLVADRFGEAIQIDTMGWENTRLYDRGIVQHHVPFDLNDAGDRSRWVSSGPYDLILAAEIIEHLHTAPEHVFRFFRELMRPDGLIVIQTPNAAALRNRLLLASGRNPYERIRLDPTNPGHFREYTLGELTELAIDAGFAVERGLQMDYFRSNPLLRLAGYVAPSLRRGLTVVLRKVA